MSKEFATPWKRPPTVVESNNGKKITETAGYIPAEVQINQLLQAGARLNDYRREQYDFGPEDDVDEDFYDPTRGPNFDMADASEIVQAVEKSLERQKTDQLAAAAEAEAAKKDVTEVTDTTEATD